MAIKKFGISIIYGVAAILLLATITSLVFSLILLFTDTQEQSISLIVTIISYFAVFIGGFICGGKGRQKGWMIGGATGLVYSLIVFMYQYLGHGLLFSLEQIIYYTCYILTAMMGGVLGVNILSDNKHDA
ncbi:TIGR04086 family membrane protein [Lederbergia lenta]|uniref:TIGR04086 family membrane protein n=1 Tax=Lederbergia lenta TaxID=1467 RepID=UPI000DBDFFA1|nr:TIGR04086 family membrane protein [Lederbergia lenta]MEC2325314.1 TIGR04086 family membrane protein [Lederbergia lenta]